MNTTTTTRTHGESREINTSKSVCDWCYSSGQAAWMIKDEASLAGVAYACTVHGTEWYPHLFPESDTTPIEAIVAEIQSRVSLVKFGVPVTLTEWEQDLEEHVKTGRRGLNGKRLPWYPLMGHREGLRRNDPVTLASALFILALEGGTAHGPGEYPTVGRDWSEDEGPCCEGTGCVFCN